MSFDKEHDMELMRDLVEIVAALIVGLSFWGMIGAFACCVIMGIACLLNGYRRFRLKKGGARDECTCTLRRWGYEGSPA